MLSGKNILIGITGGISAYKVPLLVRKIIKAGGNVKCILTNSAKEFVTEKTLSTLTGNPVYCETFTDFSSIEHIEITRWADSFVIVPATANTIGKMSNGIADNLLTSSFLAFSNPVAVAPAMNVNMWNHSILQDNIKKLISNDIDIIMPQSGDLACGDTGMGRMSDIDIIFRWIVKSVTPQYLKGKKVIVTAGPTKEFLDPVRYIGNMSSGKMGLELALSAWQSGAEVTLISGADVSVPIPDGIKIQKVTSAKNMFEAVKKYFNKCDIFISNAAIADITPLKIETNKIKKTKIGDSIKVKKTPDILAWAGKNKKKQTILGFALETENKEENAKSKLLNKNCDYIALNSATAISSKKNSVTLFNRNGILKKIPETDKSLLSAELLSGLFNN